MKFFFFQTPNAWNHSYSNIESPLQRKSRLRISRKFMKIQFYSAQVTIDYHGNQMP